ncbi:MAG: YgiT-type zinc finger protein [Prevotella sp.]|nr:YgiT-type zinc finger protein [Prevotella sp.]
MVIDDIPGYCTRCGESLADAERVLDYVTQLNLRIANFC